MSIEPLVFQELPEVIQEQIQKETQLRSVGLWEFLCMLEIYWPWQAYLYKLFESVLVSEFQEICVQMQGVNFTSEVIAMATTLP